MLGREPRPASGLLKAADMPKPVWVVTNVGAGRAMQYARRVGEGGREECCICFDDSRYGDAVERTWVDASLVHNGPIIARARFDQARARRDALRFRGSALTIVGAALELARTGA